MMPAMQARPAPSSQTVRMTLRTSMPTMPESCWFSLTARIDRPMAVRVSSRWMRDHQDGGEAERQQLVRRRPHAAAQRHRDLQRIGVVDRLAGEDELEQAAQGERGAEARHHHDDDRAALGAQAAEQQGIAHQRQRAGQHDGER